MSSETDHPRQRTVAELLAAHGADSGATGRRRRRREPDEPEAAGRGAPAPEPAEWRAAPPGNGMRPAQREAGAGRRAAPEPSWGGEARAADPWGADQRGVDQRGVDQRGADDWASEQWDGDQWGADERDDDPWGTGRREQPGREQPWEARPAQQAWDGGRESRYADPGPAESRDPAPRRARRAAEERDAAPSWEPREPARSWEPQRARDAAAWEPRGADPEPGARSRVPEVPSWDAPQPEPAPRRGYEAAAPAEPAPELATEQMPQVRGARRVDPAATSRIQQPRRRAEADDYDDDGPATMVGAAPVGAEAWHRARTEGRRPQGDGAPDDDGPPTMVGGAPAGAEAWHRARTEGRRPTDPAGDGGPPTQASAPMSFDDEDDDPPASDYPAGLDRPGLGEEPTGIFAAGDEPELPAKRRSVQTEEKEDAGSGPAWAAVIAQWIAGAIGGAALWVGFRFLWRDLPVVALAAAVLVTVGLVVVVRALLRSSDLRTTLFAVLVGLLLTVSPAILVLLGR